MEILKNKSNKKFMILSFFGIIMVVSGHIGGNTIDLFGKVFPINSFFMPMFMFISGYFFKDEYLTDFKSFFCKKTKKLLLYYLIWGLFYAIIMKLLSVIGLTSIDISLSFKKIFIDQLFLYPQYYLNLPSWFLITLYFIEITYWFIRKISRKKLYDIIIIIIFIVLNMFSVYIANNITFSNLLLFFMKIMFFMIFYILGFYYKLYFEKIDRKISPVLVIIILLIVNTILIQIQPNINFVALFQMKNFTDSFIFYPLITAITGIYFFLKLSELLTESFKDNNIINLISKYTKGICMHHLFCMYLFSIIIYVLNYKFNFNGYNINSFKLLTGYYFYSFNNQAFSVIYLLVGIFGSIGIEILIGKIIKLIERRKKYEKN